MLKIYVIIGSTREGRFGDKPANWVFNELQKQHDVETELIDLCDWPLPFYDEPLSPSFNKGVYKNELAAKWAKKIGDADGFIIVTPEYNHGYPGVLKNAIDYVYPQWNKKPVAFVSYGGSAGGTRSVQQLRQVAIELQMVPIRAGVHLTFYWEQLGTDGTFPFEKYQNNLDLLIQQLLWWTKALKTAREEKA